MAKTRIIKIGKAQGIRIPKRRLQQAGFSDRVEVEIEAQLGQLVIRPLSTPRHGWDEAFQAMAANGDDHLLDPQPMVLTTWEASEWTW